MWQLLLLARGLNPNFPFWNTDFNARTTMHIGLVTPLTRHSCAPSRYMAQRMAAIQISSTPRCGSKSNDGEAGIADKVQSRQSRHRREERGPVKRNVIW